jgi:dihydroorotate dehydrogenase (NAD+) catalytic subunit
MNANGAAPRPAPNLEVTIAGVRFANPVIAASGTFGYGSEYGRVIDVSRLGGLCSKGLTLAPKPGNTGPRLVETPSGLINSIGLENPGIPHFIEHELPSMLSLGPVVLANLSGSTMETYVEGAELLDATDVPMIELNISCPNVKAGGMAWGLDCDAAGTITAAVRKATKKPLVVKLSPNAPHLVDVAKAVVASGADALSLVNTFQSFAVDIEKARPVFDNVTAGLAGPAIRPIALRMLRDVVLGVPECASGKIPVIGLGGIATWQDAVEFIMTGATAIQVGTATFANPHAMEEIIDGLASFMARKGYVSIEDMRGLAVAAPAEKVGK